MSRRPSAADSLRFLLSLGVNAPAASRWLSLRFDGSRQICLPEDPTSPPILSSTSVESPIIRKGRSDVKKRFTEAQIIGFLREAEAGLPR